MLDNDLKIELYDGNKLYDVLYNDVSIAELIPSITAISVGGKIFKVDDTPIDESDDIVIHVARQGQNLKITNRK